jgi:hypothetical protein
MRGRNVYPLVILICILLIAGPVSALDSLSDVPKEHWSYTAFRELAGYGLIDEVYSSGFQDGQTVSRYEMALLVSRIFSSLNIDSWEEQGFQIQALNRASAELLLRLEKEFRPELKLLGLDTELAVYSLQNWHAVDIDETANTFYVFGGNGQDGRVLYRISQLLAGEEGHKGVVFPLNDVLNGPASPLVLSMIPLGDGPWSEVNKWLPGSVQTNFWNSQLLVAQSKQRDQNDYMAALDGSFRLTDQIMLDASYALKAPSGVWDQEKAKFLTSLGGSWVLGGGLELIGEFSQSAASDDSGSSFRIGALFTNEIMELAGWYNRVLDGYSHLSSEITQEGDLALYQMELKMGDLRFITELGHNENAYDGETAISKTTSVGVNYTVDNVGVLHAGYEYVDLDSLLNKKLGPSRSKTSVGLDVLIPQGKVKAGLLLEGERDNDLEVLSTMQTTTAGLEYLLGNDRKLLADISLQSGNVNTLTTSFGLGFEVGGNALLHLGYEMVDFSGDVASKSNRASAEFTIRF